MLTLLRFLRFGGTARGHFLQLRSRTLCSPRQAPCSVPYNHDEQFTILAYVPRPNDQDNLLSVESM
jgi:hypothetical protein